MEDLAGVFLFAPSASVRSFSGFSPSGDSTLTAELSSKPTAQLSLRREAVIVLYLHNRKDWSSAVSSEAVEQ